MSTPAAPTPDLRALAERSGLIKIGLRPPLGSYLGQLWDRRDFVVTLARSGVDAGNSRDRLGRLWLVLTPLLQGAVYLVIFGILLNTREGVEQFVGYLVVGIFIFQYLARMVTEGAKSIQGNIRLVQALAFPRASIPVSVSIKQVLMFGPALLVMVVIVMLEPEFGGLTWYVLLALPALALATVFGFGVSFLLARAVARVNDVAQLLPFSIRVWLYTSGVFYSFDRFSDNEIVLSVLQLNPMYMYLTLVRDALVYGQASEPWLWWGGAAWAFGTLVLGFLLFWQAEETYTRDD